MLLYSMSEGMLAREQLKEEISALEIHPQVQRSRISSMSSCLFTAVCKMLGTTARIFIELGNVATGVEITINLVPYLGTFLLGIGLMVSQPVTIFGFPGHLPNFLIR